MSKQYSVCLLLLTTLLSGTLFAQRYQGRDHTVFHAPAPPAKHAATQNAGAPGTRSTDPNRRREVTFSGSSAPRTAPPPSVSPRLK